MEITNDCLNDLIFRTLNLTLLWTEISEYFSNGLYVILEQSIENIESSYLAKLNEREYVVIKYKDGNIIFAVRQINANSFLDMVKYNIRGVYINQYIFANLYMAICAQQAVFLNNKMRSLHNQIVDSLHNQIEELGNEINKKDCRLQELENIVHDKNAPYYQQWLDKKQIDRYCISAWKYEQKDNIDLFYEKQMKKDIIFDKGSIQEARIDDIIGAVKDYFESSSY